jgi:hypothetical protein
MLCEDMAELTHPYENGANGFVVTYFLPVDTMGKQQIGPHDYRVSGVGYRGTSLDKGVMFNFCPFCGEKIDWFRG